MFLDKVFDINKYNDSNIAFYDSSKEYRYQDVYNNIKMISDFFRYKCIRHERIGIIIDKKYTEIVSILGIMESNNIVISLPYKNDMIFCEKILNDADIRYLVTDLAIMPKLMYDITLKKNIKVFNVMEIYKEDISAFRYRQEEYTISGDDVAIIAYTSGTTGNPKGVMLTYNNILSNLYDIEEKVIINEHDKFFVLRPFNYMSVFTGEILLGLRKGSGLIFHDDDIFVPQRILALAERLNCTAFFGTPTQVLKLASFKNRYELKGLRFIFFSGEKLQKEVVEKLEHIFEGVGFYNGYGLTEASPRISILTPQEFKNKSSTVGKPLKSIDIRIGDKQGSVERGEILIKGPNIMKGYYNNSKLTKNKIEEGWLHTGDFGYLDEDGFLCVEGRLDNMIIKAGINIYPAEIENALRNDPKIEEVLVWGEQSMEKSAIICMAVVLNGISEDWITYIKEICRRTLPSIKWPDNIYRVKRLDVTSTGKIKRDIHTLNAIKENAKRDQEQ